MQTFRKNERLCHKKSIDELFLNGQSFFVYPFKIIWISIKEDVEYPARIIMSVPKRNFKKAVHRNQIRRLLREVYRKNKSVLYQYLTERKLQINLALIYNAKVKLSYQELDGKIIQVLDRLIKANEKTIS
ncbi:MAG: ribonuclease P protein component [Bacteroidetes bacterium]|nr:ribonuclease P protein component [Bacteroidota bacterium]